MLKYIISKHHFVFHDSWWNPNSNFGNHCVAYKKLKLFLFKIRWVKDNLLLDLGRKHAVKKVFNFHPFF